MYRGEGWDRVNTKVKNKEMNETTYKLRRQVIDLIYEAKTLVKDLPRIDVRVTENSKTAAGWGRLNDNIIWITENYVAARNTVFHEILHAVYGIKHINNQKSLMDGNGYSHKLTEDEINRQFIELATRAKNGEQLGEVDW